MTVKKLLLAVTLIFSAQASFANGLFVEPALTYERGDTDIIYPAPLGYSEGRTLGAGIAARLGYHIGDIFFIGADGRFNRTKFKDNSVGMNKNSDGMNWGPVAGVQTPVLGLRVWGSYILGGELDPDSTGTYDAKFTDASGYRLGAGVRLFFLSVNLEYQKLKYDSAELETAGPFVVGSTFGGVNLNSKAWIASVSFPIAL